MIQVTVSWHCGCVSEPSYVMYCCVFGSNTCKGRPLTQCCWPENKGDNRVKDQVKLFVLKYCVRSQGKCFDLNYVVVSIAWVPYGLCAALKYIELFAYSYRKLASQIRYIHEYTNACMNEQITLNLNCSFLGK